MSSIISGKLIGNNKYLLMETTKFRIKLKITTNQQVPFDERAKK